MTFDQLMKQGWTQTRQQSVEDMLREKLLAAETKIIQLEREVKALRGAFPIGGPSPGVISIKVRQKITSPVVTTSASYLPTRKYVFLAFGGICFYCKGALREDKFTLDHQIPKSKQGSNHRNNLVAACGTCNTTKGDRMPTSAELERAQQIRDAFNNRPPNAEPIRDPWIAEQEAKIEEALKPKWPSVKNQIT